MENEPSEDVFPIENGDLFHCYVSLPAGSGTHRGVCGCPSKFPMIWQPKTPNKPFFSICQASLHPPNERNSFIHSWLGVWGYVPGYVGKFLDWLRIRLRLHAPSGMKMHHVGPWRVWWHCLAHQMRSGRELWSKKGPLPALVKWAGGS